MGANDQFKTIRTLKIQTKRRPKPPGQVPGILPVRIVMVVGALISGIAASQRGSQQYYLTPHS
jgi:hypothetical protein